MAKNKQKSRGKFWKGLLLGLGMVGACGSGCMGSSLYNGYEKHKDDKVLIEILKDKCSENIETVHSKQEINDIVNTENTPKDIINRIRKDLRFMPYEDGVDLMIGSFTPFHKQCKRWYSLQESYTLKNVVCIDGAIAFQAMISDNYKYKSEIVVLNKKYKDVGVGHAINVFKENGKWKYVSFNDINGKNGIFVGQTEHDSLEDAVIAFTKEKNTDMPDAFKKLFGESGSGDFETYTTLFIPPETLKFGKIDGLKIWMYAKMAKYHKLPKVIE